MQYETIEELEGRIKALKSQVAEKEEVLSFKDTQKSLSVLTHGFTDKFLAEKKTTEAHASSAKNIRLNTQALSNSLVKNTIAPGVATLVSGYARKNLESSKWPQKLLGLGVIYLLPILINKGIEYLENQEDDSVF